jgi:hypothetical protein
MVPSPASLTPSVSQRAARASLSILRTETVLSRFPVHLLTKRGRVTIHIQQTNAHGALVLRWTVSYNEHYGPPRQLAYKLDTIVINQLLDALPRPLPRVLKVGSLRQICARLDLEGSGRQQAELKRALHANASAYIVAYLGYRGRDGAERVVNAGFTRYSVILTGERLPDSTTADAVYLVLSEPYREVLNHAPVRPLDYAYLKALTPTAQRFYELLSYKMFAALKYRQPHATLRYADYCLLSTQQRYTDYDQIKKQMHKVHRPHRQSGYLTHVAYHATTDADGQPDWLMRYTPGPKARAEYAAFLRQPGAEATAALLTPADADAEELTATMTQAIAEASRPFVVAPVSPAAVARRAPRPAAPCHTLPPPAPEDGTVPRGDSVEAQADALVTAFYQRFHGLAQVIPRPKELAHATQLLAMHGEARAHFLLDFSHQAARATRYQPQTFGGILPYLPRALAAYDAQTTRAGPLPTEAATQRWDEQYLQWRQATLAQLRRACAAEDLAALEHQAHARLVAAGTPAFALGLAVRVAVDEALEARAGLLTFDVWRQQQEAAQ